MYKLRPYSDKDQENVIKLWKACNLTRPWNDPIKDINRKIENGGNIFLVLSNKNSIIGTVMGGYDGHRGVVNYLGVHPKFRGKGYGKILMKEVEKKLKELGCPKINLLVRSDNLAIGDFYKQLCYNRQDDVIVYGKRLIPD